MCERKVLYPAATPHPLDREAEEPTCLSPNLFDALPECVRAGGFTYAVVPSDEYVEGAESYSERKEQGFILKAATNILVWLVVAALRITIGPRPYRLAYAAPKGCPLGTCGALCRLRPCPEPLEE